MTTQDRISTLAHHTMAMTGGFYGIYALLLRHETFGSSSTSNFIYTFAAGFSGNWKTVLIRVGCSLIYAAGVAFATLLPKWIKFDFRYVSLCVGTAACLLLAQIPEEVDPVLALYPMFFATAVQWLAYSSAAGFTSATIFSTNNWRQCIAGLSEYLYGHDPHHLQQFLFFGGTLIFFHIGVVYAWFCLQRWGLKSSYACILLIFLSLCTTIWDNKIKNPQS